MNHATVAVVTSFLRLITLRAPIPDLIAEREKDCRRSPINNPIGLSYNQQKALEAQDTNKIANIFGSSSVEEPSHLKIVGPKYTPPTVAWLTYENYRLWRGHVFSGMYYQSPHEKLNHATMGGEHFCPKNIYWREPQLTHYPIEYALTHVYICSLQYFSLIKKPIWSVIVG